MSEEPSAADTKTEITGHVALINILGFRSIVSRTRFADKFQKYNDAVRRAAGPESAVEYLVFSDNIVIYDKEDSKDVVPIAACCSELFFRLLDIGLPFRGCIAYGGFSRFRSPNGTVLTGQPIIEAYDYQQKQNWIGIMVSPGVIEQHWPSKAERPRLDPAKEFVKRCKIPLKSAREGGILWLDGYAITPDVATMPRHDESDISKCIRQLARLRMLAPDPGAQEKYSNTLSFLEDIDHRFSNQPRS